MLWILVNSMSQSRAHKPEVGKVITFLISMKTNGRKRNLYFSNVLVKLKLSHQPLRVDQTPRVDDSMWKPVSIVILFVFGLWTRLLCTLSCSDLLWRKRYNTFRSKTIFNYSIHHNQITSVSAARQSKEVKLLKPLYVWILESYR